VTGLKRARLIWTIVFLGVTLTAIVMECVAGLWHPTGWTIPWTEYLARYVPWPIQLVAYVALAVWLPFHFWRHDHMRKVAYVRGAKFAEAQAARIAELGLTASIARRQQATELLQYALHLRMYGERAPGGDETWAEFDRRAEQFLRDGR
jgi:hypothetical protein